MVMQPDLDSPPDWTSALARARDYAPFLARALDRQPELAELLAAGQGEKALAWAHSHRSLAEKAVALRRERLALATALAIGDLAGAFALSRVLEELSGFADRALDTAIRTAIAERTGKAETTGFIALALGKQGAGELNYSSDIDPILLYDPARLACRPHDDPGEAAQRYARRIVKLLSENTQEGYVLRVDLRLRPASEISPLAVPLAAARAHYQGQALAWERAAFIRARAAAGDVAGGAAFLLEIAPFVWRQAVDFGAIEEIRALTRRIRQSHNGRVQPGPGFDVKRGRGGIREIEFFAQTHQLIHGGRDPALRVRGTRAALDALANAGCIDPEQACVLGDSYDRLRTLEHRLQMIADRQTHALPDGEALDHVARLDGLGSAAHLVEELTAITQRTSAIYEALIGPDTKPAVAVSEPLSELAQTLASLGYPDPSSLAAGIEEWCDGRYPALRSPQALQAFAAVLPALLEAFARSDDPERALIRWQAMLERLPSAINLFRLLRARAEVLERLASALTLSPALADQLARRPERLDALIDQQPFALPYSVPAIMQRMWARCARPDYEALLDSIRRETGEGRFTLGLRLIEAEVPPREIAQMLSNMAEAAIQLALDATANEFARTHGTIEGQELVVLGLGRLGGGALTHASDLDVVYLFSGAFDTQSGGARPLGATLYFNRLASRVTAALSVPTAQGALYDVDTRLRPQGNQGPLAVSFDAFAKYQQESAWTWEHMALTRARVIAGSERAQAQIEAVRASVIRKKRDTLALRAAVLEMRAQMADHKRAKGPLDVKLLRGGLVDVEFLVHYLQLNGPPDLWARNSEAYDPHLDTAIHALAQAGLLPRDVEPAHGLLTDVLVAGRLLAADGATPPEAAAKALARACGRENFAELTHDIAVARKSVAAAWGATFDQPLETNDE